MIFGWRNNPEWVKYYEDRKTESLRRNLSLRPQIIATQQAAFIAQKTHYHPVTAYAAGYATVEGVTAK